MTTKYDWSKAHTDTKMITTDASGDVVEWSGEITSELSIAPTCEYDWRKNPDNGIDTNQKIKWTRSTQIKPAKVYWLASAEMRPVTKKLAFDSREILNFLNKARVIDEPCIYVTPESVVSDIKAGQL